MVATAEAVILHSPMHTLAREQRKLAAILTADVVGYSRLMGRDESGTLARLGRHLIADCSLVLRSGSGCIAGSPVTRVPNPSGSRQRLTSALYLQAMNNTEATK